MPRRQAQTHHVQNKIHELPPTKRCSTCVLCNDISILPASQSLNLEFSFTRHLVCPVGKSYWLFLQNIFRILPSLTPSWTKSPSCLTWVIVMASSLVPQILPSAFSSLVHVHMTACVNSVKGHIMWLLCESLPKTLSH